MLRQQILSRNTEREPKYVETRAVARKELTKLGNLRNGPIITITTALGPSAAT